MIPEQIGKIFDDNYDFSRSDSYGIRKRVMSKEKFIEVVSNLPDIEEEIQQDENEKHKSRRLVSLKLSMDFRSENQELIKSLESIRNLTSDEELPLMKALNKIAHKALK